MPYARYATHTYLTVITYLTPEYRTTGDFRHALRSLAEETEKLAEAMLKHNLARTVHTPEDFINSSTGKFMPASWGGEGSGSWIAPSFFPE